MLTFQAIWILSAVLLVIAIIFFLATNEEMPLVLLILYAVSGLYRYYVVVVNPNKLKVGWVRVAYARNIFEMTDTLALEALNYFLLGTALMMFAYMIFFAGFNKPAQIDSKAVFVGFTMRKRIQIIYIYSFFLLLNFYARVIFSSSLSAGEVIDTSKGYSYLLYLPFALGGIILLMYLVFKNISVFQDVTSKVVFGGLIVTAAIASYNPGARFNFLSWVIALGIILVRDRSPAVKLRIYSVGLVAITFLYGLAGLARTPGAYLLSFEDQSKMALERLQTAEDQNLLDGFMMVLQVYPKNLPFQYGMQHLEIFFRPIPRAIWKNKPVGGYSNKLGLNDVEGGGTVGISDSLYGTFYGEGGIVGIFIFCMLYGALFAWIRRRSYRFHSDMQFLIKGMMVASIVALIRGGDLPGIVAFIGMSYWPVFIFMSQYSTFVRRFNAWFDSIVSARRRAANPVRKPALQPQA